MQRTAHVVAAFLVTVVTVPAIGATVASADRDNRGDRIEDRSASMWAARATPWVRCASGTEANYSEVLHMDGGRGKSYPEHDTGWNRLFPGDVLLIDADDGDKVDVDLGWPADAGSDEFTPDGISPSEPAPNDWPGPDLNMYGLIGFFTNGGWGPSFYGSTAWCVTVPDNVSDAFLTLAINDQATWDNSGAWDVVIKHYFP